MKRFRESSRKHRCASIIDGKKKCCGCKKFRLIDEFSKNRSTFDGYQKLCKECFSNAPSVKKAYKNKSDNLKNNLNIYFRAKTTVIKNKCIRKKKRKC